jgi:predicted lipoprotein with Yx(FWY)xxD motif
MRTTSMRRGAVALALLALAGCGSSSYGGGSAAATSSSSAATSNADLKTADTSLGKVVVNADGRTVYVFDKDTSGSGASACSGNCLAKWPPVQAASGKPTGSGVTGELGTIKRDDGTEQVTLAGMPLYLYVGDSHPGDVTGQAVGGIWWAVSPSGTKITAAAASSSSAGSLGTGY